MTDRSGLESALLGEYRISSGLAWLTVIALFAWPVLWCLGVTSLGLWPALAIEGLGLLFGVACAYCEREARDGLEIAFLKNLGRL